MRMSLTTTLRCGGLGPGDEPVVILGDADDLEVVLAREHRPHALADEDAVVGQEDRDRSHADDSRPIGGSQMRGRGTGVVRWCQPHLVACRSAPWSLHVATRHS